MLVVEVGFVMIYIMIIMCMLYFVFFCQCVDFFFNLFILVCFFFFFFFGVHLLCMWFEMGVLWGKCSVLCRMYECGKEVVRE